MCVPVGLINVIFRLLSLLCEMLTVTLTSTMLARQCGNRVVGSDRRIVRDRQGHVRRIERVDRHRIERAVVVQIAVDRPA